MVRRLCLLVAVGLVFSQTTPGNAAAIGERVGLGVYAIDRTEVTIGQFRNFINAQTRKTAAERDGGGFEFDAGWARRPNWAWFAPYGEPASDEEPVVHVSWAEARDYCASVSGRLPTFDEWRRAAYTEARPNPTDGFQTGQTYIFPVGDRPEGMNTSGSDAWTRHASAGVTRPGVNGLYDMGANVWEWLADRREGTALTAGGSWWYGAENARASAVQWKPAEFYAVYVGFRCVYDL